MATVTVTPIKTFISGETVTPEKLNQLSTPTVVVEINTDEVTTGKIAALNVTSEKLAADAVETDKIKDGAVTGSKLGSDVVLVPSGAVMPFAMNSAPTGWLAADGSAVSRSTYAALFSAIGTTHGVGNGSTTFNLPDLRGIFVRGSGAQTIAGITYSKTFAGKENDEFKSHYHSNGFVSQAVPASGGTATGWTGAYTQITGYTGGSETRPANIALLYCIKT